jgi:basic membrane protein A
MNKVVPLAALAAVVTLALAGCGAGPEDTTSSQSPGTATPAGGEDAAGTGAPTETDPGADFLACMVSDSGGFDDKSFNQSGYEGLIAAQTTLGVQTEAAESQSESDFAANLQAMTSQGCDLTIAVGSLLVDATTDAAAANPGSHFAIVDDASITLPNVKPLVFQTSEAAYLAGYIAAAQTKTGTVATFGGMAIPSVTIFMDGFVDGVAKFNADKGEDIAVLGWDKDTQDGSFTGDFVDQSKGQSLAKTFIDQGADIVMPVAGPVGLGAVAAAKEADGVAIVWADVDGYVSNPADGAIFLTSVVKEIGNSVATTVAETVAGGFTSEAYVGTLANGGVGIAPFHDFEAEVSPETKAEVDALKAAIIAGEIMVTSPSNPA